MGSRLCRIVAIAAAGFVVALSFVALSSVTLPAIASAQTLASIQPSFTPDIAGAKTSTTLSASFSGGAGVLPSPLRKEVVLLPAGIAQTLDWPTTAGCSPSHLRAHGARGCPPRSEIGAGSALLQWREGSSTASEKASLQMFVGPDDGAFTMQLLAEGSEPLRRRVVITFALFAISAPYSGGMEAVIPPIVTRPGQPDASVVSFSLTVGPASEPSSSRRGHAARSRHAAQSPWGDMGIFVPRSCPADGYPWESSFTYADGETQEVTATVPCS